MMRRPVALDLRGRILLLVGVAWLIQAGAILCGAWAPIALPGLAEVIPQAAWAAMLAGPGVVAVVTAPRPSVVRGTAYGLAVAPAVLMSTLWLASMVPALGVESAPRALASAATWALVAIMIATVGVSRPCQCGGDRT